MIEAAVDPTVEDFKELVLKSFFEDEFKRRVTAVDLLHGEKRLESDSTLADCGVSSEGNVLAVFRTRSVECSRMQEAEVDLRVEERAVYLTIPARSTISANAFLECSSIQWLTIPESVACIGKWAFHDCRCLRGVTLSESVVRIGEGAFAACHSLTSVRLPSHITSIEKSSFHDCKALKAVEIPNKVTSIEEEAFLFCSSLESLALPVAHLNRHCGRRCSRLRGLSIPYVTMIGDWAFDACGSLSSLTIGHQSCVIA